VPQVRVLERPRREEVFVRVMEGVGVLGEFSLVGVEGMVGVCEREEEGEREGRVMARRKRSLSGMLTLAR